MPAPSLLRDILILFGLGVLVVLVFHRVRLPSIVGFLMTGVLCGPYGFGLIRGVEDVEAIAELGVILLLFTIGIEFSLQQFLRLRSFLALGGLLQLVATTGATWTIARALGQPSNVALFLGLLVTLSSTAIVLRLFSDRGELDAPHGQAALAILIFQDLCVVPMVLATPLIAGRAASGVELPAALGRLALFAAGAVVAARWVFPWVLTQVVNTRKREIFLLAVIFLCLGTAWATARVGLSLALGAFFAGLVISRSEYSHQALGEILPLREVFNSLFFVSIGMLFDVRTVIAAPLAVAAAIVGIILLKSLIGAGVAFALGQSLRVSLLSGIAIAQIGEFSFILSGTGRQWGLLDENLGQLFLAAAVGTMALTPGMVAVAPRVVGWLERRAPRRWVTGRALPLAEAARAGVMEDHVIIVGYGLNGRNLARVLGRAGIPFMVVEMNPDVVRAERRRGRAIIYGDATGREILEHAGIAHARVLVIAISDAAATRSAAALARQLNPAVHIVVRSRYVHEMEPLLALGTDEVVPEEFETSIEIFSRVLRRYLVPRDDVQRLASEIRGTGYEAFRAPGEPLSLAGGYEQLISGLAAELCRVEPGAAVAGRSLADSGIRQKSGVSVVGIRRRDGHTIANPAGGDVLEEGDIVLLLGETAQIAAALPLFRGPAPAAPAAAPAPATTTSGEQ
ncbi:MAG TPA: cation:proton antiporter [Gemmatimonadaceae bacterium]|nr:cation:proton antiporter [Gemmatimonadaceae bacterium]